jgi:hypothetical protein
MGEIERISPGQAPISLGDASDRRRRAPKEDRRRPARPPADAVELGDERLALPETEAGSDENAGSLDIVA